MTALHWRHKWAEACCWGIENSGSLGKGVAQFLVEQGGEEVREIVPHRTAPLRRWTHSQDKTDLADAWALARLLRAASAHLPRLQRDDVSTAVRLLRADRDNMVGARTRLMNQRHDHMLPIDPTDKEKSGPLTQPKGVDYGVTLPAPSDDQVRQTRLVIARRLAGQLHRLNAERATITADIRRRVQATHTPLLALTGVGEIVAARLLGDIGPLHRVRSAAALAALSGTAPLAVSSGGRHRHRLNRGGHRQLHRAIPMMALGQRRGDLQAQAYEAQKRAEGTSERAALRGLTRRLVDILYRTLRQPPGAPPLTGAPKDVASRAPGVSGGAAA